MKELIEIQSKLNCPKNKRNTFGNYNYRSAEDILNSLKPLLKEANCSLIVSDELVLMGDRFYLKSTATISNEKESKYAVGFAREDDEKKGMDKAQVTGSVSSYARKYAFNGLFLIDDSKDIDAPVKQDEKKYKNWIDGLELINDVAELQKYYLENKAEIEFDPKIKALFSGKKQKLESKK